MNRHPTERVDQVDTYEQGRIDATQSDGIDITLEIIIRAQSFRLYRGRQLRTSTLRRMGLDDLISVN